MDAADTCLIVRYGNVIVARLVYESAGRPLWEYARNWVALEQQARAEWEQAGLPVERGFFVAASPDLARLARWPTKQKGSAS